MGLPKYDDTLAHVSVSNPAARENSFSSAHAVPGVGKAIVQAARRDTDLWRARANVSETWDEN